ncbi:MAG: hypothetical protein QOE44_3232 [Solirubrobacteraceae bacterium]|nr:hypothetical protein [Solirubrobacteraceae bacterium]
MRPGRLVLLAALLAAVLATPGPAGAAGVPAGYDVSFPLCGAALPAGAAFGIVGVNAGLANNANPCLAAELAWAAATPGLPSPLVPPASLYLNTADPGPAVASWPTPANGGAAPPTPYGPCDGSWSPACAYLYGAARALYSFAVAASAGSAVGPGSVPWWLDVENESSWARASDLPGWSAVNVATLKGFVAGLRGAGAGGTIGFYSTPLQWRDITGLDAGSSPAQFGASAPDWIAGVGSLGEAQSRCQDSFSGGPVRLAQYALAGLDGDYACPPALSAGLRIASRTVRGGAVRVAGTIARSYRGRVTVELSATYRGRRVSVRGSAAVVAGRWLAVVALPRRRPLRAGEILARSSAGGGLLAGAARVSLRIS